MQAVNYPTAGEQGGSDDDALPPPPRPVTPKPRHVNDRHPNFRGERGELYLVRCFACVPEIGRENYAFAVAGGVCVWCGWQEKTGYGD